MTDTIKRWECPECGRHVFAPDLPHGRTVNEAQVTGRTCPGVPVERSYVLKGVERREFIDALLAVVTSAPKCDCGLPHLNGTEHADECPAATATYLDSVFGKQATLATAIEAAIDAATEEKP